MSRRRSLADGEEAQLVGVVGDEQNPGANGLAVDRAGIDDVQAVPVGLEDEHDIIALAEKIAIAGFAEPPIQDGRLGEVEDPVLRVLPPGVEDVRRLAELAPLGLEGVIIGQALYTGAVRLEELL